MRDQEGVMLDVKRMDEVVSDPSTELSSIELTLPSKGVDYPDPAKKAFQVRPPRVREVEFLAGMSKDNYDGQLTKLLRSLIVSPVIVDPIDLTLGDRQYLHVWVRAQIDPVYRFETTCPECGHVDKDYQLKIEDIPLIAVPEKYSPNMRLTLPKSKKVVAVRLETARDRETCVALEAKGFTTWVSRKSMVITTIDGKPMGTEEKCEWLRELPAGDDVFMSEYLLWQRHGPDFANCPFKCRSEKCHKESVIKMPFRLEFFMPTVRSSSAFEDAVRGCGVVEDGDLSGDGGDQADGVRGVHVGAERASRASRSGEAANGQR